MFSNALCKFGAVLLSITLGVLLGIFASTLPLIPWTFLSVAIIVISAIALFLLAAVYILGCCGRCRKLKEMLYRNGRLVGFAVGGALITSVLSADILATAAANPILVGVLVGLQAFFFVLAVCAIICAVSGCFPCRCCFAQPQMDDDFMIRTDDSFTGCSGCGSIED